MSPTSSNTLKQKIDSCIKNFILNFSLTSDVTLHAQLMVTKTKLLGSPYTKCLPETQANKCYQEKTEENIRNRILQKLFFTSMLEAPPKISEIIESNDLRYKCGCCLSLLDEDIAFQEESLFCDDMR